MSRRPFLVRALLAAMLVSFASSAQELDKKSLERILSKQGFSGQLTGNVKVRFAFLGNMKCGSAVLHVYYYTGEETHPPGKAIHFNRRLIFLENRTYLGNTTSLIVQYSSSRGRCDFRSPKRTEICLSVIETVYRSLSCWMAGIEIFIDERGVGLRG